MNGIRSEKNEGEENKKNVNLSGCMEYDGGSMRANFFFLNVNLSGLMENGGGSVRAQRIKMRICQAEDNIMGNLSE